MSKKNKKEKNKKDSLHGYYDGPIIPSNLSYEELLEEIRILEEKSKLLTEWEAI